MTLEASFTKCQGLCSFQEHFHKGCPQYLECLQPILCRRTSHLGNHLFE